MLRDCSISWVFCASWLWHFLGILCFVIMTFPGYFVLRDYDISWVFCASWLWHFLGIFVLRDCSISWVFLCFVIVAFHGYFVLRDYGISWVYLYFVIVSFHRYFLCFVIVAFPRYFCASCLSHFLCIFTYFFNRYLLLLRNIKRRIKWHVCHLLHPNNIINKKKDLRDNDVACEFQNLHWYFSIPGMT